MFVYGPHGHLSESESEETNLSDLEPEEMLRVNTYMQGFSVLFYTMSYLSYLLSVFITNRTL